MDKKNRYVGNLGNKETMAKNLQHYMYVNGESRRDVCEALDLKYTTFCDWCKGKVYPRIDKIELLANHWGIQKSDLVEERIPEDMRPEPVALMERMEDPLKIEPKYISVVDAIAQILEDRDPLRADLVKAVMRIPADQVGNVLNLCNALNSNIEKK